MEGIMRRWSSSIRSFMTMITILTSTNTANDNDNDNESCLPYR